MSCRLCQGMLSCLHAFFVLEEGRADKAAAMQLDPISAGSSNNYQWWEEAELRELTAAMGLQNFKRQRSNRFILFSARKPAALYEAAAQPAGARSGIAGVGWLCAGISRNNCGPSPCRSRPLPVPRRQGGRHGQDSGGACAQGPAHGALPAVPAGGQPPGPPPLSCDHM